MMSIVRPDPIVHDLIVQITKEKDTHFGLMLSRSMKLNEKACARPSSLTGREPASKKPAVSHHPVNRYAVPDSSGGLWICLLIDVHQYLI